MNIGRFVTVYLRSGSDNWAIAEAHEDKGAVWLDVRRDGLQHGDAVDLCALWNNRGYEKQ